MNEYYCGEPVLAEVLFTDESGAPVDPDVTRLTFGPGDDSASVTKVYGSDGGYITKVAVGHYQAAIDSTPFHRGRYTYQYEGDPTEDGDLKAVEPVDFWMNPLPLTAS